MAEDLDNHKPEILTTQELREELEGITSSLGMVHRRRLGLCERLFLVMTTS